MNLQVHTPEISLIGSNKMIGSLEHVSPASKDEAADHSRDHAAVQLGTLSLQTLGARLRPVGTLESQKLPQGRESVLGIAAGPMHQPLSLAL